MTDKLVEIGSADLPALKKIYKDATPDNFLAILTIENYIRWFEQDPDVTDVKFFCLNGDFSDGTFVVVVSDFIVLLNVIKIKTSMFGEHFRITVRPMQIHSTSLKINSFD